MSPKLLIRIGLGLALTGVLLSYSPGLFGWFGKLAGDIRIEGRGYSVFIPITSMAIVSAILSVLVSLYRNG